ncbi:hypothetical protein ACHAPU_002341 [Fusarium lateritium]
MKLNSFLLSIVPLTAATKNIPHPSTDCSPEPVASAECCPFTYKQTCTKNIEKMYHFQPFYNRKEGISPYSQYHSTPEYRDLVRVPGAPPVLEFDGAAEFWVQNLETFQAMYTDPHYLNAIQPDEANFIDPKSMRLIVGVDYIVVENQNAVTEHGRTFS